MNPVNTSNRFIKFKIYIVNSSGLAQVDPSLNESIRMTHQDYS